MRLLILTQIIDSEDTYLGFFHYWVSEFAHEFETITIICLKEGKHALPENVRVLSLGKEDGVGRVTYLTRFFKYIWQYQNEYDTVFVHMNQEYVLLGGWLWKYMGKKITMWRNHYAGSMLTDIASFFCDKVFCTSKFSYTAKYAKTVLMPVGVPEDMFTTQSDAHRTPNAILYFGRISPSKKLETLIRALGMVKKRNIEFSATLCGDVLPEYVVYKEKLLREAKALGIAEKIQFREGVPYAQAPALYAEHEICVNMSPSGMYDKTIFEAMLSHTLSLSCNENLHGEVDARCLFREEDSEDLAEKITTLLKSSEEERRALKGELHRYAREQHGLQYLAQRLKEEVVPAI